MATGHDRRAEPLGPPIRLVLFDLDGTLYQSDDLYRLFADVLSAGMSGPHRHAYLRSVTRFLEGRQLPPLLQAASDWSTVARLAEDHLEIGQVRRQSALWRAYGEARAALLRGELALSVPSRLADTLRELCGIADARVAVVTNGPDAEARALLCRLGVEGAIDRLVTEAGKPEGLVTAARALGAGGGRATLTCSVGDNWSNDIEPAIGQG